MAPVRVQLIALNVPSMGASVVKPTVPVGVVAPVEDLSVTVAVHVTVWPTKAVGGQLRVVVVGLRAVLVTVTVNMLLLVECDASPA